MKNAAVLAREAKKYLDEGDASYEKAAERMWQLRTQHGWTFQEIGDAIGRSKSTVRRHVEAWNAHGPVRHKAGETYVVTATDDREMRATRRTLLDAKPSEIAQEFLADPQIRQKLQKAQDIAADKMVRESKRAEREALGDEASDQLATQQSLREAEGELSKAYRALVRTLRLLDSTADALDDAWREEFLRWFDDIADKATLGRDLLVGDIQDELEQLLAEEA